MPRYFFHLKMGKVVQEDLSGRVLQDDMMARAYALQSARQASRTPAAKPPGYQSALLK
jgi:hypothetical protein